MSTDIGRLAVNGMYAGPIIAIAPVAIAVIFTARDGLASVIGGIFVSAVIISGIFVIAVTNGQWNTAFNIVIVVMMPPTLWKATWISMQIGAAISTISFLGFLFAEGRIPMRSDFNVRSNLL